VLDDIARPGHLSRNSLRHIKSALSGIFKFAKQQGYYDGENPVRDTANPTAREAEETYAYSLEEIGQILAVLPEPAATIFAVAAFTGARRGEVAGLRWENYNEEDLRISQSVWQGKISEPKNEENQRGNSSDFTAGEKACSPSCTYGESNVRPNLSQRSRQSNGPQ
jgi:integrase